MAPRSARLCNEIEDSGCVSVCVSYVCVCVILQLDWIDFQYAGFIVIIHSESILTILTGGANERGRQSCAS